MLLELCLVIGGVIFFKNRKKRRAEDAARQDWYNSGNTQSPPPPQAYPPYRENQYGPQAPQSPSMRKPPVLYGNTQEHQPLMSGPAHREEDAPPAYASLRPQNDALGYERQDFSSGDQKRRH